jgi:prevent-host-death family protein
MNLAIDDIVPISRARAQLTELADQVSKTGRPKLLTKNGESYVAIVTAEQAARLADYEEEAHLSKLRALLEAARDLKEGRTMTWDEYAPVLAKKRRAFIKRLGISDPAKA